MFSPRDPLRWLTTSRDYSLKSIQHPLVASKGGHRGYNHKDRYTYKNLKLTSLYTNQLSKDLSDYHNPQMKKVGPLLDDLK